MPRARNRAESLSVSPMTKHPAPLTLQPQRGCPSPPSSSVYSREIDEDDRHDRPTPTALVSSVNVAAINGRADYKTIPGQREPKVHLPRDSGIGAEFAAMQYGHPSARELSGNGAGVLQHPTTPMPIVEQSKAHRLSTIFIFGQESKQVEPASEAKEEQTAKPKRHKWSSHFWTAKSNTQGTASVPAPHAGEAMEISQPKLSRFRRIRKSVSDMSASLKQMAGRKRSRDETEEPLEAERNAKVARKESPPPILPPHTARGTPTLRTVQWSQPPSLPAPRAEPRTPPTPPPTQLENTWPGPSASFLSDPEVLSLLNTLKQGPSTSDDADEVTWTRAERAEFGLYVRAAEDEGWRMALA